MNRTSKVLRIVGVVGALSPGIAGEGQALFIAGQVEAPFAEARPKTTSIPLIAGKDGRDGCSRARS